MKKETHIGISCFLNSFIHYHVFNLSITWGAAYRLIHFNSLCILPFFIMENINKVVFLFFPSDSFQISTRMQGCRASHGGNTELFLKTFKPKPH